MYRDVIRILSLNNTTCNLMDPCAVYYIYTEYNFVLKLSKKFMFFSFWFKSLFPYNIKPTSILNFVVCF